VSSQGSNFARALAMQQAGALEQAERLYEQVLRVDPQHAAAWHLFGLVVHRCGRPEQAVDCISRAVSIDPSNAIYHADLATICHELGRLDEAIDSFLHAVELAPGHAHAHYSLGVILQKRGDNVGARLRFQQAVELHPEFAEAWNDLGITHLAIGELAAAGECFERLIALLPRLAGGHFNLGNVRLAQGRLIDAVGCYARSLERQPRFVEALNNLGTALQQLGRIEPARQAYEAALNLRPEFADARNNLGALLSLAGRHGDAEICYREALALDPRSAAALNNLGSVLQSQMRLDEAERLLRQAIDIDPYALDAPGNLANVLAMQGRLSEAVPFYGRALELQYNPRLKAHAAMMLPPVYASVGELRRCRETLEANLSRLLAERVSFDPSREAVPVNFLLAYQGLDDRELASRMAQLCRSVPETSAHGRETRAALSAPHFEVKSATARKSAAQNAGVENPSPRPIRIGFLSKFLREHTIGDLTKGLIGQLSRDDFCVSVFLVGEAQDETVAFLRSCADSFAVLPEDVSAARRLVADAQLDVLVYPDIGMEPVSTTLAHSRLARVQCALWGHPVTTCIPNIDYFISSALVEPAGAADHYSERLVLLKSLPTYYYRPRLAGCAEQADPARGSTAVDRESARWEFGLPQSAHLYVCPQSLFKFHPDFDPLLADILARDPAGRVVLIEAPHRHWTQMLSKRFESTLSGLSERVIFVPRVDRSAFLRLLASADVALDPLHFGGGNTSFQALGLGIPVVTLPSGYMRGRVTAGCYRKMDYRTLIARDVNEYVDLAVRLGTDPGFNAQARAEINARSSALFEDLAAVREFEDFFRSALPPGGPSVPEGGRVPQEQEAAPFALLAEPAFANPAALRAANL